MPATIIQVMSSYNSEYMAAAHAGETIVIDSYIMRRTSKKIVLENLMYSENDKLKLINKAQLVKQKIPNDPNLVVKLKPLPEAKM